MAITIPTPAQFHYSYNNITTHQLLHVSAPTGPSSGNKQLNQTVA